MQLTSNAIGNSHRLGPFPWLPNRWGVLAEIGKHGEAVLPVLASSQVRASGHQNATVGPLRRSLLPRQSCPGRGGEVAFESLLMAELPILLRVATRLTLNPVIAEDLVGQTVLKALKSKEQFEGKFLRSWLVQILNRTYFRELSRPANRPTVDISLAGDSGTDIWPIQDQKVLNSQLLAELDHLPEQYRMAIVLCDLEELDYNEAAEALGVPVGTVRSRLFRGRRLLRMRAAHLFETNNQLAIND